MAHSTRRLALLLLLMIVSVVYFKCATAYQRGRKDLGTWPPSKRWDAKISVDTSNPQDIKADPRITVVWDVEPDMQNPQIPPRPSNKPSKITWTANDPNFDLVIDLTGQNCNLLTKTCHGNQCTAIVNRRVQTNMRCTYKMFSKTDPNAKDEDADIIIMPCCS